MGTNYSRCENVSNSTGKYSSASTFSDATTNYAWNNHENQKTEHKRWEKYPFHGDLVRNM